MKEQTTKEATASRVVWEHLEEFARAQLQEWLQALLEEEMTALLGRKKSERVKGQVKVYRNGHGKPRQLSTSIGTITVERPRVRGLEERFESKILPLFRRHTRQIDQLLPDLYLHGLSMGDFDLALRGLLGEGAPLSPSSLARLKEKWQAEYERWQQRSLAEHDVVYMWVDGVYVKAGLEKQKAALLVIVGALRSGKKVVLAVESGYRESSESWASVLRDLKRRGLKAPRLVIGDGHLGIWGALTGVYPEAEEQRCWNHRIRNVLSRVPQKRQSEAKRQLHELAYAEKRETAEKRKVAFQKWCQQQGFPKAGELLDQDWERMVTFFSFPEAHWTHLRTTNVIESPFAGVRLRTDAAKRFKKVENATAVIWKTLMLAEQAFRVLKKAELLAFVADGVTYVDGIPVWERRIAA